MFIDDEKDYILRMIRQTARALMAFILGKEYNGVELPKENRYTVAGTGLDEYRAMIDEGRICEAEDMLLENLDYSNQDEIIAAVLVYQYMAEKEEEFLEENNFSLEEIRDGIKGLADQLGYGEIIDYGRQ